MGGTVATIMGILGEVAMGTHRVEAGLLLRKAILHSSLLFSAEAWSNVNIKEIKRLEQVGTHLLKLLLEGHSKCPSVFYHLETGTLMLRHILTQNRMMYHHHILTRNENETILKIYKKQKEEYVKGDWYQLLKEDFIFVENEMNDEEIKKIPKETYKKMVKKMVKKAAFKSYTAKKETHQKIRNLEYEQLELKPYLKSNEFSGKERKLLTLLRSRCHPARNNFKKMHQNQIKCSFGCNEDEDQEHTFVRCEPIKANVISKNVEYGDIFKETSKQKEVIEHFLKIETERIKAMEALLPGGGSQGEPWGALGSPGEPRGAQGSQGEPRGALGSQGEPWGAQGSQGEPRGAQGSPGEPRGALGSPGEPRGALGSPGSPGEPWGALGSPGEPRGAQGSQGEPRGAKGSPGEPRGALGSPGE